MPTCVHCGHQIEILDRVMRRDECPGCGADLHTCVQCRFYKPGRRNDCAEPVSELVADKEKANYCEWFEFAGGEKSASGEANEAEKARDALEALFKKS